MTLRGKRTTSLQLDRQTYREARRRWIAGERDAMIAWLRDVLGRPTLTRSSVYGYARRQGWPVGQRNRAT